MPNSSKKGKPMHLTEKIYSFVLWLVLACAVFMTRSDRLFSFSQSASDLSDLTTHWPQKGPESGANSTGSIIYSFNDNKSEGR